MSDHIEYKPATPQDLAKLGTLGRFLEENRTPEKTRTWKILFFALLGVTVVLNLVIPNHHPHFGLDKIPGFWPVFGLVVGIVMVFFVKKIVQPLIKRPEDHYADL
jgi:hypothetical protein